MRKSIFFDLDETLVDNNAFIKARHDFAQLMVEQGFDYTKADNLMEQIDSEAVQVYGFGDKNRFGESMVLTYENLVINHRRFMDVHFESEIVKKCMDICNEAHSTPVKIMDGALSTLEQVRDLGYHVYIVTKGDKKVQHKKIIETSLYEYVEDWFIFDHKTLTEMYEVLKLTNSVARDSYFVGNSPKSDVNPAYLAGMGAVYIAHPNTWSAELEPVNPGVISIGSISELATILET